MDLLNYFVFVLVGLWCEITASQLDDYITQYEELNYDTDTLHQRHLRYRRSNTQRHLIFKFNAYNRDFQLELVPDESIFTPDFLQQHSDGSTYPADTSFVYTGKVKGDPASYVHGSVLGGVFRGFVVVGDGTVYHIEHARRFFPAGHVVPYHSVIYRSNHVNLDPYRYRRPSGVGTCGLDRHWQLMNQKSSPEAERNNEKTSRYSRLVNNGYNSSPGNSAQHDAEDVKSPNRSPGNSAQHDTEDVKSPDKTSHSKQDRPAGRVRRNVPTAKSADRLGARNTCYMYLRSDPVMWRYIKQKGMDDSVAKNEIMAMFASNVAAINLIYNPTNFTTYAAHPTDYYYTGVRFRVQRTSVMTDRSENCNTTKANQFCNPDIDVSNFLDLTSREDHDQFCLAFTFTARDFSGGTLGLAWVASPENAAGGICEKYKPFSGDDGRTVSKSLNTGIVTIINYGKRVAPTVSHLTFAHEVGHNFGSPHDTGICAPYKTSYPGAADGNYIMYASATHGDLPHNHEFSPCSKDNMTRVLHSLLEERFKKNCLQNQQGSFCGNGIVEKGEECDCGYQDDCDEKCCNPRHEPKRETDCKLKSHVGGVQHVDCSPSQGPCCTSDCQYIPAVTNKLCRASSDCIEASSCPGTSAKCPETKTKPDIITQCNGNLSVCQNGECTGSLCKTIGYTTTHNKSRWEECMSSTASCYLSCQLKESNGSCVGSNSVPSEADYKEYRDFVKNRRESNVYLPAGSPCNDFKGYCDVFSRCRGVNNNGPLARLQNLIFGNETWSMIREWIVVHWWIVMLMAIGLILIMIVFIKICGVNTPSINPKHKPVSKVTPTAPPQSRDSNHEQIRMSRGQYLDDFDPPPRKGAPQGYNRGREPNRMDKRQRY